MAIRPNAAQLADGVHYFPPGHRLGIRKPDGMAPLTGDPCNLLSPDQSFQILFWDLPALGGASDFDWWNDRPNRVTLLSEQTVSPAEQRRLFELAEFAGDRDHSWFTFLARTTDALGRPDWFGRLHLITSTMARSPGARARWRETIAAVVASAIVRPSLSVPEMLAEHRVAMDLAGLHPHHFGSKLIASLKPPRNLAERWTKDGYIAMEEPPARLPYPWTADPAPDAVAAAVASHKAAFRSMGRTPYAEWTSNEVDWIVEAEQPLMDTGVHAREAQGFGRTRMIKLRSYRRDPDRSGVAAALERVARSVRLDD